MTRFLTGLSVARSFMGKAGWIVAVLAALGAAGYTARNSLTALLPVPPSAAPVIAERAAQPVRVTRVTYRAANLSDSYTGSIRPQQEVPMGFRLPGKLIARLADVGDRVTTGQIVARLDDTDARLELEAAEAEQAAARTDLDRAAAELARNRDLFAAGHVAQAALDRATSAAAEARSRVDRADQMRELAANRLSYMTLVAEADGIITATLAETGQVVAAGQPVLSVAQAEDRDVVFALPEQQRELLDSTVATATLWGASGTTYALVLRDISPDVDPVGRTYRVRMTLTDPDAAAAFGRTVTVSLQTTGAGPVASLPIAAVINDGAGAAVWRLPKGADLVERVAVDLVTIAGRLALVRGGLVEGDVVVSLGASKIDPSRPVRVVETTASPES
jgi:RND family efflux transporter MFP subunit